ncbi:hypothetical protein AVEN_90086-1, partial [Araneus ventricosus]
MIQATPQLLLHLMYDDLPKRPDFVLEVMKANDLMDLIKKKLKFNTLTAKPPVTGHATSILVGRISAGCCSEMGEKAVGRVVIKGILKEE